MTNGLMLTDVRPENAHEVTVSLTGVPSGSLFFVASRLPDPSTAEVAPHSGSGPYRVALRHSGLWYIWARDNNGISAEPLACWAGLCPSGWLTAVGLALRDRIAANRLGIESAIREPYSRMQIAQVLYGSAGDVSRFPAILVYNGRVTDQYVGFPALRELIFIYPVLCMIPHEDEQTMLPVASAMGQALMSILNQLAYDHMRAGDLDLCFCRCDSLEVSDIQVDEKTWVATASMTWTGRALLMDGVC